MKSRSVLAAQLLGELSRVAVILYCAYDLTKSISATVENETK